MSYGQISVPSAEPPPTGAAKTGLMIGWGAVIALTAGIFWATTRGVGTGVRANRRRPRRNTRRGSKRRTSRRTSRRRPTRRRVAANIGAKKPYMFMHPSGKGFRLVVFASSLPAARRYVKTHAASSAHRGLKYVGQGHPSRPENWVAAIAKNSGRRNTRRGSKRRTSRRNTADRGRYDVWDPAQERFKLKNLIAQARHNVRAYQRDVDSGRSGQREWRSELAHWKAELSDLEKKLRSLRGMRRNTRRGSKRRTSKKVSQAQLRIGTEHELEHTKSRKRARQIALDHLREIPDYYTRLGKMEKRYKRGLPPNPRKPEIDRIIKALAGLKMSGRDADYKELVGLLRKQYGAPYTSGLEVHARQEVMRLTGVRRNTRRVETLAEAKRYLRIAREQLRAYVKEPLYPGCQAQAANSVQYWQQRVKRLQRRRTSKAMRRNTRRRHVSPFLPFRVNTRRTSKKRVTVGRGTGAIHLRPGYYATWNGDMEGPFAEAEGAIRFAQTHPRSPWQGLYRGEIRIKEAKPGHGFRTIALASGSGHRFLSLSDQRHLRRFVRGGKLGPVTHRRVVGNTRRTSKRRSTAKSRVGYALSALRQQGISPKRAGLNPRIAASIARRGQGLYRVGRGKVTKYKPSTSLQGAMTSTRIAASSSGETHWLVKVFKSGRPKVVVVRKVDPKGMTVYRVEEAAQRARATRVAANPRRRTRSRLTPNDLQDTAMILTETAAKQMPSSQHRKALLSAVKKAVRTRALNLAKYRKASARYKGQTRPRSYFQAEYSREEDASRALEEVMRALQKAVTTVEMDAGVRQELIKTRNDWLRPLNKHYNDRLHNLSLIVKSTPA